MLYETEVTLALAAVGHEAHAHEAQDHHGPGGGLGNRRCDGEAKIDNLHIHEATGNVCRDGDCLDKLVAAGKRFYTNGRPILAAVTIVSDLFDGAAARAKMSNVVFAINIVPMIAPTVGAVCEHQLECDLLHLQPDFD
jgi:hypothetical protein